MSKPEAIQKATQYIHAAIDCLRQSGMNYAEALEKLQSIVFDLMWHGAW